MEVKKILNNNAIIVNDGNEEVILTGKGLGFDLSVGDVVDESKIEKKFVFSEGERERLYEVFKGEKSYYDVSKKIFGMFEKELNVELYERAILELADHICFLVERTRKGEYIQFTVINDVISIYNREYHLAKKSLEIINDTYNIKTPEDEAGFIAFHIVSAEKSAGNCNPLKLMSFVSSVINIINEYYPYFKENDKSLTYSRMVMHLRFLGNRILEKSSLKGSEILAMLEIYKKNKKLMKCVNEISDYIDNKYNWKLSDEERIYIMIHIQRIEEDRKESD